MTNDTIKVWDPLVRIFHWSLVLAFFISYVTGEEESGLHEFFGYAVLGLVGFRIVWGLVGTRYARFSDFVYSPSRVKEYLVQTFTGRAPRYLGHNPAGGYMVVILLVMLLLTCWTGIEALDKKPVSAQAESFSIVPLAHANGEDDDDHHQKGNGDEFWEEVHEVLSNLTLFLVFVHIAGVVVSSLLHRENLVCAMVKGYKRKEL